MSNSEWQKQIEGAYDEGAAGYDKSWQAPYEWLQESRDNFVSNVKQGSVVLDLGCGTGLDSKWLTEQNYRVIGSDVSRNMLKYARRRCPTVPFFLSDLSMLDLPKDSFEAIWFSYVLLHIPRNEVDDLLKRIKNWLIKGGVLFLSTSLGEFSGEEKGAIAGLKRDDSEHEIQVNAVRWSKSDLEQKLSEEFEMIWSEVIEALPGKSAGHYLLKSNC